MDNTRRTLVGLIFSALIALLVGVILQLLWETERLEADAADATRALLSETLAAVTATADIIPTATPTTTVPTVVATTADYTLVYELANEWPLLAYEPFENNLRGWVTGGDGLYARGRHVIEDGRYHWEMSASEAFTWWVAPIDVPFDNFYATVTLNKRDRMSGDMSIVFHYIDGDNYYEFGLCDDVTEYRVYKEINGSRFPVVPCTPHPAINAAEPNHLSVLAQTDRYLFFINDEYATEMNDAAHLGGGLGTGINMEGGQTNVFEFDDIVVRSADIEK